MRTCVAYSINYGTKIIHKWASKKKLVSYELALEAWVFLRITQVFLSETQVFYSKAQVSSEKPRCSLVKPRSSLVKPRFSLENIREFHIKFTEEHRKKLSESRQKLLSKGWISPMKGKSHSEESKQKMSDYKSFVLG